MHQTLCFTLYSPSCLEEVFSGTHLQIIENLFTRGAKTAPSTPIGTGCLHNT